MSLAKIWRDFSAKKTRTLLVILSIAIGVLGITTIIGTLLTLESRMLDSYLSVNPADITINTNSISAETLTEIASLPNVKAVEGVFVFHTRWQVNGEWELLRIIASPNLATKQINKVTVSLGQLPTTESLLMERTVQDIRSVAPNDSILIQTPLGEKDISVAGIAYDPTVPSTRIYNNATGFMTLATAEALFGVEGFNEVHILVTDETIIEETSDNILSWFQANNLSALSFANRGLEEYPGKSGFGAVLRLMGLLSLFAVGLCTFIVINTIVTILATEIPQIGTMKAIGATRWMVMRTYFLVILGYGLLGSTLGLIGGILAINWLTHYMADIANIDVLGNVKPPIPVFIITLIIGIVVPLASAFIPVLRSTGVTVHEAMVSYGLEVKTSLVDRLLAKITSLPPNFSLALRNTFRNKGRAILTILTLTISGVCFVAVHAASASLTRTIDIMSRTMDADVFAALSTPADRDTLLQVIGQTEEGTQIETWLDQAIEQEGKVTLLRGVPQSSTLYAHQSLLIEGRWFNGSDTNSVILTEKYAFDNGYAIDDLLTLDMDNTNQEWQVIGIVRDYINEGNIFFIPYEELAKLLGVAGQTNMVLIQLSDRSPQNVNTYLSGLTGHMLQAGYEASLVSVEELQTDGASQFQIIISFLLAMIFLISLIGTLGLMSTLTINVTERLKEIGVMRSIGASTKDIIETFWLEGIFIGVLGWISASLLGYPAARAFIGLLSRSLFPVEFSMPITTLLLLGLGMLVVVSVASIFPALSASRARVSDILRYG